MQISPINYNYSYKSQSPAQSPAFNANRREIFDKSGKMLYKTTTYFFRDDIHWNEFITLLQQKYKDADKVNFIVHCCSNGPEAYSCATSLIDRLGDKADKFLPILAKDINPENIEHAKRHSSMGLSEVDFYRANYYLKDRLGSYFNFVPPKLRESSLALVPNNNLKTKVVFEQGDIFKDIEKMSSKNTVLMCRNFWPYLSYDEKKDLAQKLSEKFDNTSLIVIGDFDCIEGAANSFLLDNGFVQSNTKNVYTKPVANNTSLYCFI